MHLGFKNSIVVLILMICSFSGTSQEYMPGTVIICPADPELHDFHVAPPKSYSKSAKNGRSIAKAGATFEVTYTGFTPEAKVAFQHAVDIWASVLKSEVIIRIDANWVPLGEGVLGSAGSSSLYKDFENAPFADTWYPVALAEKLAGKDLNGTDQPDINASFSSEFDWYLGLDGRPGNTYDLVTVVLHEIGHGLGFSAIGRGFNNGNGFNLSNGSAGVYTPFVVNGNGQRMLDFENGSTALGSYLQSDRLFIDSPLAVKSNNDVLPKLYAPATYAGGSSIAHWNDATFDGSLNALMTHAVARGEGIHDPGPNTLSLFADMGWYVSGFDHQAESIADRDGSVRVETKVFSDTVITSSGLEISYLINGKSDTITAPMIQDGDVYYYDILTDPSDLSLSYAIIGLEDAFEKSYTFPKELNAGFQSVSLLTSGPIPYLLESGGDFESNEDDFVVQNISGTMLSRGNSTIAGKDGTTSGDNAWVFGLTDSGYAGNSEAYLYSPIFDFSILGNYELSFNAKYSFEAIKDGFRLEYTTDYGKTWLKLNNDRGSDWYDMLADLSSSLGANSGIFSGTTNGSYVAKKTNLSFLSGQGLNVAFRFVVKTDGSGRDKGMAMDDFMITGPVAGPAIASFGAALSSGSKGCENSITNFYAITEGSVASVRWDFGNGITASGNEGIGPHDVTLPLGENTITMEITDLAGAVFSIDTVVVIGAAHNPTISTSENSDGTYTLEASSGDSYQWYWDGNPIEGAVDQTQNVSESGSYSVEVLVNGCIGKIPSETVTISVLGLNKVQSFIYPNPASDFIMLKGLNTSEIYEVRLYSLNGKLILKATYGDQDDLSVIDVSSIEEGFYILEIKGQNGKMEKGKVLISRS